jgi:hypothetical protein
MFRRAGPVEGRGYKGPLVCIPYFARGHRRTIYALGPEYNWNTSTAERLAQLSQARFAWSQELAGYNAETCRNPQRFREVGVTQIVICDEYWGIGHIGPNDFAKAMHTGRAPTRVPVGKPEVLAQLGYVAKP